MDLQLKGKVALVTGASRGLGYATAHLLAQEGARLIINSRNSEKLDEATRKIRRETGADILGQSGDLTNPSLPEELVRLASVSYGGLDILITNAGGPPSGSFESFDDTAWYKAFELSFMSHARLIRASLPLLRQSTCPSVLAVTSYSVKQPIPNLVLSNAIRSATVALIKSLALELGSQNIRFNSILPAWTETERVYELMRYRAQVDNASIDDEIRKQAKDSPFGRMGRPEEFANAAVFLSSPAASYITGVMLTVDGGMYKGTL
jgi:3-oxoacyl-[acyl-carrier protein] reductase